MYTEFFLIRTAHSHNELMKKLQKIVVSDFDDLKNSPKAKYYGEFSDNSFDLRNKRFSPMSSAPNIEGEIIDEPNDTIVKIKIDIKTPFEMVRKTYYRTLLPIGVIIMLLSVLIMGGTEFQWQSLILSSSFVILAFLAVAIQKISLIRMKSHEIREFVEQIHGKVVEEKEIEADLTLIPQFHFGKFHLLH